MIHNKLFILFPMILHHCIRNHTDASLQSRSIFHQIVCNQLPDLVLHIILLCTSRHTTKHTWKDVLRNGTIHVDHLVQMTDVHQTISRATRHLRVDLGNHDISTSSSILTPNVQNPCLLHYEYTLTYLTSHVHIHFSSIQDVIQTIHSLLLLTKIRCRTTESLSSLEDSPNKLPTLTENLLLCSPALLLTPLLLLGHILDFVLKRIYAFVRIFNTFSTNDK